MTKTFLIAATFAVLAGPALAEPTEIVVQYPYGELFNETQKQIAEAFMAKNPDIKVTFRAPYESYEDATQKVLREAITKQMPDYTFQGLNRVRIFVERGVAQPLDEFIKADKELETEGFHAAMYDIGAMNGKIWALPFAISLPVSYYNLDLVEKAGGDPNNLPTTWEGVIELAKKIKAIGGDVNGVTYCWDITGNWLWQAPVFARGGTMLTEDESKVAFDGAEGRDAMRVIGRFVTEVGMPNLSQPDGRAAFAAGKTGIHFTSTSDLAKITDMIGGKFRLKTWRFPGVVEGKGRLPAGGNVGLMLATDPAKKAAVWKLMKFWHGPEGAAIVAKTTGYMPPNKKANEVLLKDFYETHPNNYTAVSQLPLLTKWYAFPGENGLKITDVIKDHMNSVVNGKRAAETDAVVAEMAADVQKLLPRK